MVKFTVTDQVMEEHMKSSAPMFEELGITHEVYTVSPVIKITKKPLILGGFSLAFRNILINEFIFKLVMSRSQLSYQSSYSNHQMGLSLSLITQRSGKALDPSVNISLVISYIF